MKKFTIINLSILALILSCKQTEEKEELFGFMEAQPSGINNLTKFPNRLLGKYIEPKDSSILSISRSTIERTFNFSGKIHLSEAVSIGILDNGFLVDKKTDERIPAEKIGDSIRLHFYRTDTIFNLSSKNVLRKFKGYYFLNSLRDSIFWTTKKLKLEKGKLIITIIDSVQDFQKLKPIKENKFDTVAPKYKFKPTKREFRKFLKEGGFAGKDKIYFKIN